MKLTAVCMLMALLQVSARGTSQKITYSARRISLERVFPVIEEQTGYSFFYNNEDLIGAKPVTVDLKNVPLEEALLEILKNQPLTFAVHGRTIVISAKPPAVDAVPKDENLPPPAIVRGRIVNERGQPVESASVLVAGPGFSRAAASDKEGRYALEGVPDGSYMLTITFVGYETYERKIQVNHSNLDLDVTLKVKVSNMEETVIVGYGTQKKVDLTGAVDQISGDMLQSRPLTNVGDALQGTMASLNITTNGSGGQPDNTKTINVRGYTGYNQLASPLVLIDGVPADINSINVNDIQTITMLKDAAASAIYGSRAPYGVLLITTKQGKKGQSLQLSYTDNFSVNNPINLPQTMNSYDFANIYNEASENAGDGAIFPQSQIAGILQYMKNPKSTPVTIPTSDGSGWDPYTYSVANNDWFDIFMKKNVASQQHNLSLEGGSDKITYFLGLGYNDQNGSLNFFKGYAYQRYNFRANINAAVTKWMSIGLQTSYSQQNDKDPISRIGTGYNWFYDVPTNWVTLPLMDPNGGYDENTMAAELASGNMWQKDQKNDSWIKGNVDITPLPGWEIHGDYAFNYYSEPFSQLLGYFPVSTPNDPEYISSNYNQFTESATNNHYHSYNIFTSYEKSVSGHYFKAMVGQQEEYQQYSTLTGYNTYLYNQSQPSLALSYGTPPTATDAGSAWATFGTFGRFNYNYKEKYLLELNGRYMGTSLFPADTRYHFFSSASAGWNVSKEAFFAPLTKWVSNLKFRGSYGGLGDISYFLNQPNYYPYLANLGTTAPNNTSWPFSPTGTREPAVTPPGLVSPTITWDKPAMLDFGVDVSFLRDFNITFDWYKRTIRDLFGPGATYPGTLGTPAPTENNATTETTGFDLTADWKHQFGKVNFTVRALLSNYKGKVISYSGNPTEGLGNYYNGEPIGAIWGYKTVGKFQTQAQVAQAPNQSFIAANWYPGDIQYADLNHDGKINNGINTLQNHGDQTIIGNSTPQYNYGLNLGANWNGFDVFAFFQGVGGGHYYPSTFSYWGVIGTDLYHAPPLKTMYDRWTPTNPNGYFPRAMFNDNTQDRQTQSGYLVSLAYLRFKNMQLGYTLPPNITRRWHFSKVRFYGSVENILTIAPELKHSYIDPEELEAGEQIYPLMRTVSAGVQVNIQ